MVDKLKMTEQEKQQLLSPFSTEAGKDSKKNSEESKDSEKNEEA